jgi:hypothetical protein
MTLSSLSSPPAHHRPGLPSPGVAAYDSAGPTGPPDLAYARRLADAAERLGDATDVAELWSLVAREALALIEADGVAVLEYGGRSWHPLATELVGGTRSGQVASRIDAAAQRGLLTGPGGRTDLECPGGWRSLLVMALDRRPSRVVTRLLWFADGPGAFAGCGDLADLFARHAGTAVRAVTARESLSQAAAARQRVGQAVGILMSRYRMQADPAMALLRQQSQYTNTKLRIVAQEVILTGDLPRD